MQPRDVILGQLDALAQELYRCRDILELKDVDGRLRKRVETRLDGELTRLDQRHAALVKHADGGSESWTELAALRRDCAHVFDECLAFVQGAWARTHGLDEGLCDATDDLLDDLDYLSDIRWMRFTLLATSEFYRSTAEIIRIKYPDLSFWSIPLAAHEFGHYAAGKIVAMQKLLEAEDENRGDDLHSRSWYHLQEYFSDVFATCALGPAYAAAFMLLRASPGGADDPLTHPPFAARMHAILRTLEAMDARADAPLNPPFRDIVQLLDGIWRDTLQAGGAALSDAGRSKAQDVARELFNMLTNAMPLRFFFGQAEWLRAQATAAALNGARDVATMEVPEVLTRREVLNAAWLLRLADGKREQVKAISRAAFAFYRRMGVDA